ncbi:MAG TPA: peroxidase family protein, partial [Pyrinomonadaceae bacterium]
SRVFFVSTTRLLASKWTTLANVKPMNIEHIQPLPSKPNHYGRLFRPDNEAAAMATDARLADLALSMKADVTPIPEDDLDPIRDERIMAGYTYFGQFIDHDLTYDISGLPSAGTTVEPEETRNFRTTYLNLENLYGAGPANTPPRTLYEDDGVSFRLGAALGNGRSFDVPLGDDGKPQTADPRNIENAIVRQIHAMFLQLHNLAVLDLPNTLSAEQRFREARQRVTHQFQWLVHHDFLPAVCNCEIAGAVRSGSKRFVAWRDDGFCIPVEFAQACFRFGHSLVKPNYLLGGGHGVSLSSLFGGKGSSGALPTKFAVEWDGFLGPKNSQHASMMDTVIASPLFEIPVYSLATFTSFLAMNGKRVEDQEKMLPWRTLKRGAASRLPSGQKVQARLCPDYEIIASSSYGNDDPWRHLVDCGLRDHIPLWYYILLEAQLNETGTRLGRIGSIIVAETIEGALQANKDSYVHMGSTWKPKCWKAWDGVEVRINKLHDLARVLGLASPLDEEICDKDAVKIP